MNVGLGPTIAGWIPGTINDVAAVAGAEAIMISVVGGYKLGSKAIEYSFTGMEKIYDLMYKKNDTPEDKVWIARINANTHDTARAA